jgi:agmatinase
LPVQETIGDAGKSAQAHSFLGPSDQALSPSQPEGVRSLTNYKELGLSCFGPATFVKAPIVAMEADWHADIAVLGVPFDQGTGFRSGTRWGSRAIRDMSVRFSSLSAPGNPGYWDLRTKRDKAVCRFADCGDVDIVPLMWEVNFDAITSSVKSILAKKALPYVLGGDHSITFPVVRSFEGCRPITVVQFDAHIDYRDDAMGVRFGHGNVMRRVRELAWVERIISVGIRSSRTRREDYEANQRDGNVIIPAWDVHSKPLSELERRLPKGSDVYITFDIDAMDPGIAPGTGTPEVGGLTFEQARAYLEVICARNRLVGFDLVELNPSLDPAQITALLAVQIMMEVTGFLFNR